MTDAEPVLFVDDDQPQLSEGDVRFQQGVGADQDLESALGQLFQQGVSVRLLQPAGQQSDAIAALGKQAPGVVVVLLRQDLGGRHEGYLGAILHGDRAGLQGHDGLAAPDISLQEAIHGIGSAHVLGHLVEHPFLRPGRPEGEKIAGGPQKAGIDAEGHPANLSGQAAFPADAHFQEKQLLEDHPPQSRSSPGGQIFHAGPGRGEMGFLKGGSAVHEVVALQNRRRQGFRDRGKA